MQVARAGPQGPEAPGAPGRDRRARKLLGGTAGPPCPLSERGNLEWAESGAGAIRDDNGDRASSIQGEGGLDVEFG